MSIIAQLYHLTNPIEEFLLAWLLLCTPVLFSLRSNSGAILFIVVLTIFGVHTDMYSVFGHGYGTPWHLTSISYWVMFAIYFFHYRSICTKSNSATVYDPVDPIRGGILLLTLGSLTLLQQPYPP